MKVGIVLPVEGPIATREAVVAAARTADELGFHSVWATDRLLKPTAPPASYPYAKARGAIAFQPERNWLDPVVTMSVAAAVTERAIVGSHVLVAPYRHPVVLAQELATLDALSGGRVIAGLGAGWMREEFGALGLPAEHRGARLDEAIDLARALWTGREVAVDASFGRIEGMTLAAQPHTPGGPPIYIGGQAPPALRRVAERGDGWLGVDLDPDETAACIEAIRDACRVAGNDQARLVLSMRRRLEPAPGLRGEAAIESATGGTASLVAMLRGYERVGVTLVVLDLLMLPDLVAGVRWLGERVLPEVAGAA